MKRPYRAAIAAAALALVIPVSGCAALISPQQTHTYQYDGGDGAATSLKGIDVRGLLLITNDDGAAQLFYTIVNTTDSDAKVDIAVGSVHQMENVKAGETLVQDPQNAKSQSKKPLVVKNLKAKAGDLTDVNVTIDGTTQKVQTQVLDGSLWYYKTLEPSAPASSGASQSGKPSQPAEGE